MTKIKATSKLSVSALALLLGIGFAQPASADGLLSGTLSGAQKTVNNTLGAQGAVSGAMNTVARADGNTLNGGSAVSTLASRDGILSRATGTLGADGKMSSLDVFGDDLVKVDLEKKKVSGKAGSGAELDTKHVNLGNANADALLSHAVNMGAIPRAKTVSVDDKGRITLGADAADGTHVRVREDASTALDAKDLKHRLKDVAKKLPVSANHTDKSVRVAANLPQDGSAEARLNR
jgi:hypothetical protein